jgi:CTP:molybdopterin cytidylyltransferase MocA
MAVPSPRVAGILLAAGAGSRAGGPKALRRDTAGMPWLQRAVAALREGGCDAVLVVLGADAERAASLVPAGVTVVVAKDWADGLSASLRAGLAAAPPDAIAVVVTLVDLPGLPAAAVEQLLAAPLEASTLRRATHDGRPGHPVVLGRDHWAAVAASAHGDRGAGRYLRDQGAELVELSGLWDGADEDGADDDGPDDRR